jgi:hypothetical protein
MTNARDISVPIASPEEPSITAAEHALCIVEILENILVHLPIQDIYKCQMASSRWQAVIERSPALQRRMWLVPTGKEIVGAIGSDVREIFAPEIVLETKISGDQTIPVASKNGALKHVDSINLEVNPLVGREILIHRRIEISREPIIPLLVQQRYGLYAQFLVRGMDKDWSQRSWNKMLFTEPPCTKLFIIGGAAHVQPQSPELPSLVLHFSIPSYWPPGPTCTVVENPSGITIGDIREASVKHMPKLRRDPYCHYSLAKSAIALEHGINFTTAEGYAEVDRLYVLARQTPGRGMR